MRALRRMSPLLLTVVLSCGNGASQVTSGGVFFPTHHSGDMPSALLEAKLVKHDGCLFGEDGGIEWLVLWPDGYAFDDPNVLDRGHHVIATIGHRFTGGGGGVGRDIAEELTGTVIPPPCRSISYMLWGPLS